MLAEAPDPRALQVNQLFAEWDRNDSPGAAVAVVRGEEVLLRRGYGTAQLEYGVPIRPGTLFQIASVSKQFTAAALLLLEQEGQLSLDDPVSKHLPEFENLTGITLRQLLHHTSGMRDQWDLLAIAGWRLDDVITQEQILRLIRRQREFNFPPGSRHLYCNTGYTLLAEVVGRVSGQPLAAFARQKLFEPLGMASTGFQPDHETILPNRAYSYGVVGAGRFRKRVSSYATAGATSLYSSVDDLARWAVNLATATVGGPDLRSGLFERGALNDGPALDYAGGLVHGRYRGLPTLQHGGADAGFRSYVLHFPEVGFTVVVLANREDCNASALSRSIADIYLKEELGKAADGSEEPAVPLELLAAVTGHYRLDAGVEAQVALRGGSLYLQSEGETAARLEPGGGLEFVIREIQAAVTFFEPADGESGGFTLRRGEQEMKAVRIPASDHDPEELSRFAGEYYGPEQRLPFRVVVRGRQLVLEHPRHPDTPLRPQHGDVFTSSRWWLRQLRFLRDAEEQVTGLTISSNRVWNLRFQRISPLE